MKLGDNGTQPMSDGATQKKKFIYNFEKEKKLKLTQT